MSSRTIIIENNTTHKGKPLRRPFTCQIFESGNKRTYVLDETKRDVIRSHFVLSPGCKIIDDGVTHVIKDIWYPPRPKHPHLVVFPELTV